MTPIPYRRHTLRALILGTLMLFLQACATGGNEILLQPVEKDVEQGRETAKIVAAEMGTVYRSADRGANWEARVTDSPGSFWGGLALRDGSRERCR